MTNRGNNMRSRVPLKRTRGPPSPLLAASETNNNLANDIWDTHTRGTAYQKSHSPVLA